jgi:hypothetical protein
VRARFGSVGCDFGKKGPAIPSETGLKPLVLLAILNCMAQKSGSSHPRAPRNVKNAQFSGVFMEFLWG